jgi:hypothetical protein
MFSPNRFLQFFKGRAARTLMLLATSVKDPAGEPRVLSLSWSWQLKCMDLVHPEIIVLISSDEGGLPSAVQLFGKRGWTVLQR